ncbi:hypothetical protein BBF96_07785 [Anoxybacter fermentans]|uniref:precorrin-2 dehydrogenase n=1 Tax=Anoxybacter fermentans TaxID=1323375 RepID=A0A3Q9HQA9_9FIRM|nr:bifunctional precorrin-2 dehydrogenase/sirohydrochlorin ferrochelatase [Anoxybacter fermentans]AZR73294.1 hypothetical protein BBF96_07785 [Anoxybacter fermentans]
MYYHYPVALRLKGKVCLVVGGGQVAYRKVLSLLECGTKVKLVSPQLIEELRQLVEKGKVIYFQRKFTEKDLDGVFLVIGATDDRQVNSRIGELAQKRNLLVNIVDQPEDCNFIVPAIHRTGALTIAITTEGKSPALAGKIRRELAKYYPEVYGLALDWLGEIRSFVQTHLSDQRSRRKILISLASDLVELLKKGQIHQALERVQLSLADIPESEKFIKELMSKNKEWLEMRDYSEDHQNR